MLNRLRASGTWALVVGASRLGGVGPREIARVRRAVFGGAGAVPVVAADARQRPPMHVTGLAARPWHDPSAFPSASALGAAREEIAGEALGAYAAGRFAPRPAARVVSGRWSTCNLRYLGVPLAGTGGATTRILDTLADVSSLGLVYFCALEPGTILAPHGRHTNAVLRLQLNLRARGPCGLSVGGEAHAYTEGECLAVDDSFTTEEWNRGTSTRLALVVDVWHPELTAAEIGALDLVARWSLGARRGRRRARRPW